MDDVAIKVDHVSKTFKLPHEKNNSIKSAVVNFYRRKRTFETQEVLKDVSFEIKKGEFFGIVGRNGSGKSTLLKMLASIYYPTKGGIQVNGKLTPFIELGVGFNPELTGRENVFLNGALLGFNRKEMAAMYHDIVAFAELERFMDQKLKNYSSGMQVRLAFSIAIRANTPILLLDEVLAVGDALFQKKCYAYFKKLRYDQKTVVLVSHDTGVLQEYCDSGILIERGEIVYAGGINKVVSKYIEILNKNEEAELKENKGSTIHIGNGRASVISVQVNKPDSQSKLFTDEDKNIHIKVEYKFNDVVEEPIYGLTINDLAGQRIFAGNSVWSQRKMTNRLKGNTTTIEWKIPNIFNTGTFLVTPAVAAAGGTEMLDQADDMQEFKVSKRQLSNAFTNLQYEMHIKE